MARTNDSTRRRGGGGTGRPHRYANTNAGVNRSQSRAAPRAEETYRRRNREHRGRPRATVPAHASLASRMTYGYSRGHGHGHGHASLVRGGAPRAQHQQARPLQERITRADDGRTGMLGTGVNTVPRAQIGHRAEQIVHTTAANDVPNASPNDDIDIDINIDSDIELDELDFFTPRPPIANNTTADDNNSSSTLFYSSQPTTTTPRPIRMLNSLPLTRRHRHINNASDADDESPAPSSRPVNTYRGNDPIKRRVQNPKLRAIFADKPVPKERKVPKEDRMDLRQGMGKAMK